MDENVKQYLLELGRIGVLAAIPVLIVALESGVDIKTILILVAVAVLKALDKMLHKSGIAEKGLARF